MEEILPIVKVLEEHGHFTFLLNAVTAVLVMQLIKNRDEFAAALLHLLNKWIHFCSDAIAFQRAHNVEKLSSRISQIYTILYALSPFSPLRAMVIRNTYYPKQKFWRLSVVHEADFSMDPLKPSLQNIELDPQSLEYFITTPMRDGEIYVPNVEEMEKSILRGLFVSFSIQSFTVVYLGKSERRHYCLLVAFNREDALSEPERSRVQLAAQNIKNEIFV